MEMIVDKFVKELNTQLAGKKLVLSVTPEARRYLAGKGHDPRYGARPLSRVIQEEIKNELSNHILFGKLAKGGEVVVGYENEELVFDFK